MHRLILVKTCNEIQLAHVYEHMYLNMLTSFFKDKKLLNYLDYRWYGKTYHGGFIYIDIILISDDAKKYADQIPNLDVEISAKTISKAIFEVTSEKKIRIGGDSSLIEDALVQLHKSPWQNIESIKDIDFGKQKRSRKILWETDEKVSTHTLKIEVANNSELRNLSPLFTIMSEAILDNIADDLVLEKSYFYGPEQKTELFKRSAQLEYWHANNSMLDLDLVSQTINWVISNRFVIKLSNFLKTPLHRQHGFSTDELSVYEETNILVGDKGWVELATPANITELLKHTAVTLKNGKSTEIIKIKDLL